MPRTSVHERGPRTDARPRGPWSAAWLALVLACGCGAASLQPQAAQDGDDPADTDGAQGGPVAGDGNARAGANDPNGGAGSAGRANVVVGSGGAATTPAAQLVDDALREDGPLVARGSGGLVAVPMTGCPAADYHGRVTVGGSDFDLLLDSGSASAAIAGSACASCGGASRYNAGTGTNLNRRVGTLYGSGSWTGQLYSDRVAFGTSSRPTSASVTVKFGVMGAQTKMLNTYSCVRGGVQQTDGILGLGPDSLLTAGSTSLLTALGSAGQLAHDAFAVQTCDVGGNLLLGGYTAELVREQPFFVPMVANAGGAQGSLYGYYYSIEVAGLRLGGNDVGLSKAQLGDTLVDNGTTLTYLPTDAYHVFLQALTSNPAVADNFDVDRLEVGFTAPLREISRAQLDAVLPKFGITLMQSDGKQVTLQLDATKSYLLPGLDSAGGVQYALAVREGDGDIASILGNTAMRQHLVIFDRGNRRIGFAAQRGCDETPSYMGG